MNYFLNKLIIWISVLLLILTVSTKAFARVGCTGRMVNPITDVCWKCLFPITIAGLKIVGSAMPDTKSPRDLLCLCKRPGIPIPIPGIPIGFWEPVRLADVTKSPMCMVSLGGISLGTAPHKGMRDDTDGSAFYHIHWYIYPVIYWLEILLDFICMEMASVDVAWLSEYDPLWNNDSKSAILNPEALLFGNMAAHSACIVDCAAASVGLSSDHLFWCAGCHGSLYPFTGTTPSHNGGVGTSVLIVSKFIAQKHRELMLWGYYGKPGMCGKYPMPIIKKSQYRMQMTYPIPEKTSCKRIGQTEVLWQAGREYPIKGEDWGYLIWRKRDCCLF